METTSPLFLLLVLLFSVSGVRATLGNSEDDFEENNHRVDAEQGPFTSVTLAAKSGDVISTLFRSCLASSVPFDATFASIETPRGTTYIRYVPDSIMLGFPMQWENAVVNVSDIFGCASVAEEGGYIMFKYSANACKLAKNGYNLGKVPECEDKEEDAVFIKPGFPKCVFPSVAVGPQEICVIFTDRLMTQDAAASFCASYDMELYVEIYNVSTLIVAKIKELGYTRNMWVCSIFKLGQWTGGFSPKDWVTGAPPSDGSVVAYLDSQAGWKIRGVQKSALAGAVCIFPL